eukprot:TRINITY_DN33728_c0_g1_i2.p4 TRINITY_DN33728_c0_g1~~TRINITY_DN33728_c0_g1_i2.p4  ORF type:complete len:114 (-),score=10.21 TRINITY_DN33728_c0_g1_i2:83-424(-)
MDILIYTVNILKVYSLYNFQVRVCILKTVVNLEIMRGIINGRRWELGYGLGVFVGEFCICQMTVRGILWCGVFFFFGFTFVVFTRIIVLKQAFQEGNRKEEFINCNKGNNSSF